MPFYRATAPRGYMGWGKSHALGTGLGLIMGAKLAAPDKFCVNFMGDAAFGMTGLDFETAVRCGIPITTIVLNNSAMAIERHALVVSHDRYRTRDIGGHYADLGAGHGRTGRASRRSPPTSSRRSSGPGRRTRTARPCCSSSSRAKRSPFSHRRALGGGPARTDAIRRWLTLAHSSSPDADYGAIQDLVAQACFAETAGFDGIWLTEHNFTGESVYCDPIPFASAVAARTSRIRIGFAVLQLALRHPIRLATELALLDNLSGGRLDVGVGHGTNFNEYEFIGFGLRSDDSRERMDETLDMMVRAWTESPLVHDGKFYRLQPARAASAAAPAPAPAGLAGGVLGRRAA